MVEVVVGIEADHSVEEIVDFVVVVVENIMMTTAAVVAVEVAVDKHRVISARKIITKHKNVNSRISNHVLYAD